MEIHQVDMRVEYKNSFKDMFLFQVMHWFFSVPCQIIVILFCLWNSLAELNSGQVGKAIFFAAVHYVLIWTVSIVYVAIMGLFKDKNFSTTHILEVNSAHFYEETRFTRSFVLWAGVLKAVSRPGFFAVYVGPQMAHIIPSRAFESNDDRSEFIRMVKSNIAASRT